ncbi:MAG: RNA-directed DNA polymerase [Lachnospiraceae bacterium]|nr:RNA-directed DNA polymerase [Lachnospiraceae bacterium]
MIVYKELSSLCHDLGFSARALYTASNSVDQHYHTVEIPKGNGETRTLHVPDPYMKTIQKSIAKNLLAYEEVSPYAIAYRFGGSTKANAAPHVGHPVILKMDIRKFFDHITYPMVKEKVFPEKKYAESNRILLSILCVYDHTIPQGAPTSPAISNIILREYDDIVGKWCENQAITYTRYCDDMTFSGDFEPAPVIAFVKKALFEQGFFVNNKKTVVLRNGQRKEVTRIIVNQKISVPASYKKSLRQELYYCEKFGIESHLKHIKANENEEHYIERLLGRVNYILSVEPDNQEMKKYRQWLLNQKPYMTKA